MDLANGGIKRLFHVKRIVVFHVKRDPMDPFKTELKGIASYKIEWLAMQRKSCLHSVLCS